MTSKKIKPTKEVDYRLVIAPFRSERENKERVLFRLETTKHFTSFQYEISVEESLADDVIRYSILGLKAPRLSLPSTGPAVFQKEYAGLQGKYQLIFESLDGTKTTFPVTIGKDFVRLGKTPPAGFIEVVVGNASHYIQR